MIMNVASLHLVFIYNDNLDVFYLIIICINDNFRLTLP